MPQYRFLADQVQPEDVASLFDESEYWLTRRGVAEALGIGRSTRLINILEQLVADGVLKRRETALANRAIVFEYGRADNA